MKDTLNHTKKGIHIFEDFCFEFTLKFYSNSVNA